MFSLLGSCFHPLYPKDVMEASPVLADVSKRHWSTEQWSRTVHIWPIDG